MPECRLLTVCCWARLISVVLASVTLPLFLQSRDEKCPVTALQPSTGGIATGSGGYRYPLLEPKKSGCQAKGQP